MHAEISRTAFSKVNLHMGQSTSCDLDFVERCSQAILADLWREKEVALLKACQEEADMEMSRDIMLRSAKSDSEFQSLQGQFVEGPEFDLIPTAFVTMIKLVFVFSDRANASRAILELVAEHDAVISKRMADLGSRVTRQYKNECLREPSLIFSNDGTDTQSVGSVSLSPSSQRPVAALALKVLDDAKAEDIRTVLAWESKRHRSRNNLPQFPTRELPSPFDEKLTLPGARPKRRRKKLLPPVIDAALRRSSSITPQMSMLSSNLSFPSISKASHLPEEQVRSQPPANARQTSLHGPSRARSETANRPDAASPPADTEACAERPPAAATSCAHWELLGRDTVADARQRPAAAELSEPELTRSDAASAIEATRRQLVKYAVDLPSGDPTGASVGP